MTPEKLKEIEQRYLENGDALDASSYCVLDLIYEVRALRIDNSERIKALEEDKRLLNWQKEQLEAQVATLQQYVDDVEWFNAALADKDWPTYAIEFMDGKPTGVNMMKCAEPEHACGDTLIEAIRDARKGAER